jgi:iron complex transport system permease protein
MNNVYERWKGADFINPMLFIILLMLILISLSIGAIHLGVLDVARIMFTTFPFGATSDHKSMSWVIVELVRLPRILLATLCGMSLSLSGAVMQGVFRNPLVGPEIIGVSSGAALGGVIAIILSWPWFGVVGLAFAFGLVALLLVFIVGGVPNRARTLNLVLAGVIVSGFCGALVGLAETLANPATILPNIVYWLLGSYGRQLCQGCRCRRRHRICRHGSPHIALAY